MVPSVSYSTPRVSETLCKRPCPIRSSIVNWNHARMLMMLSSIANCAITIEAKKLSSNLKTSTEILNLQPSNGKCLRLSFAKTKQSPIKRKSNSSSGLYRLSGRKTNSKWSKKASCIHLHGRPPNGKARDSKPLKTWFPKTFKRTTYPQRVVT